MWRLQPATFSPDDLVVRQLQHLNFDSLECSAAALKAFARLPITLAALWWWYPVGSVALVAPAL